MDYLPMGQMMFLALTLWVLITESLKVDRGEKGAVLPFAILTVAQVAALIAILI